MQKKFMKTLQILDKIDDMGSFKGSEEICALVLEVLKMAV